MKRRVSPTAVVVACALWMAAVGNLPLWQRLDALGLLGSQRGSTLVAGFAAIIAGGIVLALGGLAWRWTLKPVAIALLLVTAVSSHFMLAYGVVIDPGMIVSAVQTNAQEAMPLLTGRLAAIAGALAIVPGWLVWRTPVDYGSTRRQLARNLSLMTLGVACCLVAAFATLHVSASVMRNHKEVRYLVNPFAALYSAGRVAERRLAHEDASVHPMGEDATLASTEASGRRPTILLLVLGETARSGNFGINGYGRPTTPSLEREGAVSFRNAWSCGTSTAESVPCMFSGVGRAAFVRRNGMHEGLLDVLQRAGLAVLWIDNQTGCKGVCDRVPSASTAGNTGAACTGGECFDDVMLEGLDRRIGALDPERVARGLVIVMHPIGSHGPAYFRRSPESAKRFLPECRSTLLDECTHDELVNAYDNSIAYTDAFLGRAIGWLRRHSDRADTALVYVADHGESLGENGLYLHGMPYLLAPDAQRHIPWITWVSEGFRASTGLSVDCLRAEDGRRITHDSYFHSVLGLMGVATKAYDPALDAYANCRGDLAAQDG